MRAAYDELYVYTMSRPREAFVLQHVVDAWAAQTADGLTKPIKIVFALLGLYLHLEHGYSGLRVQQVHMQLGKQPAWPSIALPADRGAVTPADVLTAPAGDARDRAIDAWCASVWAAYGGSRPAIVEFLAAHGIVGG
jgi:hypothetical protein